MSNIEAAWTQGDAEVLAAADRRTELDAAALRLAASATISLILVAILLVGRIWNEWILAIAVVNVAWAAMAHRLARLNRFGTAMPWLLATVDAVLLFAIARFGLSFEALAPGSRAALVSLWGGFLVLALMALRSRAGPILYQSGLLTLNFAAIVLWPAIARTDAGNEAYDRVFSSGANVLRAAVIVMTGLVLAAGARRSRLALKAAIRAARERSALQRFLPEELDTYLTSSDLDTLQRGQRLEIGVLFADIRDFTALSEHLDPFEVADLLRSFRGRAERAVARHGGVIDKFIGDGLLAVFGLTAGGKPASALDAALALADEIQSWNTKRQAESRRPIGVGIGAHVGEAFVGVVGGGGRRLEFTVIGDVVNVAQRLEEATRVTGAVIVASAALLGKNPRAQTDGWAELPSLVLRGHTPVEAFALGSGTSRDETAATAVPG